MRKIPTLFVRDYTNRPAVATEEVTPGAEWVIAGEGVATQKFDGTCCLIRGGRLFKRYDAKKGKTPPPGFEPAQAEPDPVTGHWPGWLLVGTGPDDRWFREAFWYVSSGSDSASVADPEGWFAEARALVPDGTYELIGPKLQGNPERARTHNLIRHGAVVLDAPREYDALREWLRDRDIEGIVWHHPDGRMVKLKGSDFGLKRGQA